MQLPAEPNDSASAAAPLSGSAAEQSSIYTYFEQLPLAVAILEGQEYNIIYFNTACSRTLGLLLSEVKGKPLFDVLPYLRNSLLGAAYRQVIISGQTLFLKAAPLSYKRNNEQVESFFDVTIAPFNHQSGDSTKLLITGYDVTEQVNAQHKSEATAIQLTQMADAMPQLVWIANADGTVIYYNRRIAEYGGARQLADGSWEWTGMVHPDDQLATSDAWEKAVREGSIYAVEHRIRMSDYRYKWHLSRAFPYRAASGAILQWFGTATDIDEQRKAAERLRQRDQELMLSQSKLGMVINAANIGVWQRHIKTGKIIWSKELEHMYGLPEGGFGGTYEAWKAMVHPDDFGAVITELDRMFTANDDTEVEYRIIQLSGAIRWILSKIRGFRDADNNPEMVLGVSIDVTRQHLQQQSIAEAEERWRIAIEANNMGTWEWNTITNEIELSQSAREILGIGRDEPWHFVNTQSITYEEDVLAARAQIAPVLKGEKETFTLEARFHFPNSYTLRWARLAGKAVRQGSERPAKIIGTIKDITPQKESDEALLIQKQLLETVTENTSFALFMMDENQYCVYMNEQAEKMTGYKLQELQSQHLHSFLQPVHPDGSPYPAEESPIDRALPENRRQKGEDVFMHKDGHFFPVSFTASPIIINSKAFGTVIEVRDITEKKKAAQVLRLSEERFHLLTNAIPQITWISGPDGFIDYISDQWEQYTGQTKENAREHFIEVVHPDDRENMMKAWAEVQPAGNPLEIEYRLRDRNGAYRWFFSKTQPLRDSEGNLICWIGAATDIQYLKDSSSLLEQQVAERTQALSQLNQTLQQQASELQRSNEELQQFAHVTSHDLKEPVRKIKTFGSRLRDEFEETLPDRAKLYVQKMDEAAQRIYTLIDGVLEYAQLDAAEPHFERVELQSVLEQIASDLEVSIQQSDARIQYENLPVLKGIPILLYQLFYNLINNALKFARPDVAPVIRISASATDAPPGFVAISVQDNGIGFAQEHADKIFKTFTRLNPKEAFEGTGLGLAICRKIAARHGGSIAAFGNKGAGATFTVILPADNK